MQIDCFPDCVTAWPKSPVAALATINPPYPIRKDHEYPFIEMAGVGERFAGIQRIERRKLEGSGLSRFKVGDILFAKITPCPENGKVAFIDKLPAEVGLGSTEFIVFSPRSGANPRFLFHLLCSHSVRGRAAARMEGSTGRQRVPEDVFTRWLLVPRPEQPEQEAIASILDRVDIALERSRTALESAKVLHASLLQDLLAFGLGQNGFVRDPQRQPAEFRVTTIGALPASWTPSTVTAEFSLQNGFTLNEQRRPRFQRRRYLRVANVQRDSLDLADIQELEASDAELAPRVLATDDLLVVEGHADRMQIGRCARVTPDASGMTFQNHLFRLRSFGRVVPGFGSLWLNSAYARRYWNARCATSSGLNTINQRTLKRLVVPVPEKEEQQKIVGIVSAQRRYVEALMRKCAYIEALKKSLADDLIAGRAAFLRKAQGVVS